MSRRPKYYVPPPNDGSDFKDLFRRMTREGAGRPTDESGLPLGPWTPELLTAAISEINANQSGINLRTVQRWFQENNQGIKSENIRWLATVFGCAGSDAQIKWQVELAAAQRRLILKRRHERLGIQKPDTGDLELQPSAVFAHDAHESQERSLAYRIESMFLGRSSLNLPITVWAGICTLWFLAYGIGVHNITYSPAAGIEKQVGLFWAPSWNIGEALFIPLFLIVVSDTLSYWKQIGRKELQINGAPISGDTGWDYKVKTYQISYRWIALVSLVAITILQWVGVYLLSFLRDGGNPVFVDWLLVSIVEPQVVSVTAAFAVSIFAYIYNGYIYWLFLNGAMIQYQIVSDFSDLCYLRGMLTTQTGLPEVKKAAETIYMGIYKGTVFGIILAIAVKLNAVYLETDGENILIWLLYDTLHLFGFVQKNWVWINGNSPSSFSSVLLLFVILFVYTKGEFQLRKACVDLGIPKGGLALVNGVRPIIIAFLTVAFAMIGSFTGFSAIVILAIAIALWSLYFLPYQMLDVKR